MFILRMDEVLYLYDINIYNIYLHSSVDNVAIAENVKNGKRLIMSKTNRLKFCSVNGGENPIYRIIIISDVFESVNVAINIAIPFYSKDILKRLTRIFSSVYLIKNFPSNKNTSGMFSIIVPNAGGLRCTMNNVQRKLQTSVSLSIRITKIGFIHIYNLSNAYESIILN